MQEIIKNLKLKVSLKHKSMRGFTMGLALIIVAAMLLISVSISTLLLRDLKNSASNIKSSIAYNLAESALECAAGYENNIKYFDASGAVITGIFPVSTSYAYVPLSYGSGTAGYANSQWSDVNDNTDNGAKYKLDSIKCFGESILYEVNNDADMSDNSTTTIKSLTSPVAMPAGFAGGVVTSIKIKKDLSLYVGTDLQDSFKKYLQNACVSLDVYATNTQTTADPYYKKLIVSKAQVPCAGGSNVDKTERVLVRYMQ
jgi:hypothetical protein